MYACMHVCMHVSLYLGHDPRGASARQLKHEGGIGGGEEGGGESRAVGLGGVFARAHVHVQTHSPRALSPCSCERAGA